MDIQHLYLQTVIGTAITSALMRTQIDSDEPDNVILTPIALGIILEYQIQLTDTDYEDCILHFYIEPNDDGYCFTVVIGDEEDEIYSSKNIRFNNLHQVRFIFDWEAKKPSGTSKITTLSNLIAFIQNGFKF